MLLFLFSKTNAYQFPIVCSFSLEFEKNENLNKTGESSLTSQCTHTHTHSHTHSHTHPSLMS